LASWTKLRSEENGKTWLDWVSIDDCWKAAEGHDEPARKEGRPWTLFRREKGQWRWVAAVKSLNDAKALAASLEEPTASAAES